MPVKQAAIIALEQTENYEKLKDTAKTVAKLATSDDLYYGLCLFGIMIIAVKLVDLIFYPFANRRRQSIFLTFMKGCIKAFIIITISLRIISLSETLSGFTSQFLMSSSLLVVVLGFVFQEGLSNIVHGFILSIFKPFRIGDRVHITVDGQSVTGYVTSIDLRNTVIKNVLNSSHVIVPNSKMDLCIIENNYFDDKGISSNFLDLCVTYESNLKKAVLIVADAVGSHPLVQKSRNEKHLTDPVSVMVRELGDNGVYLRASVTTCTVEENFAACSDIRWTLVERIAAEPDVEFAYPHIQVVKKGRVNDQEDSYE